MWKSVALALLPAWAFSTKPMEEKTLIPINQADLQPAGLDGIFRHLYHAYRLNLTAPEGREQQEFSSETWKYAANGGLKDQDRKLLFDMYKSVHSVFEFGLGESTKIAAAAGVPRYFGVDSDALYVDKARKDVPDNYRFYFADVGPTKS